MSYTDLTISERAEIYKLRVTDKLSLSATIEKVKQGLEQYHNSEQIAGLHFKFELADRVSDRE